nr:helix-turn-helix domain-containing protein [Nannocystis pusilla]
MPQIILENYNLEAAERRLCVDALESAGNIVGAAQLLGITRHSMKRRIVKLRIDWPRPSERHAVAPSTLRQHSESRGSSQRCGSHARWLQLTAGVPD